MRDRRDDWHYTDGRGVTLTLPRRPRRIAVAELLAVSTLAAAGIRPVAAALGPDPDGDVCFAAAGFAPGGVARLDTPGDPAIDPGLLAAARPDLVVDRFPREHGFPAVVLPLKERGQSLDDLLAETARLAVALGASPPATDSYQAAKLALTASLSGRTIIFGYARGARLSILDPSRYPWLVTLHELGLRVLGDRTPDDGPHGTPVAWSAVSADLIMVNGEIPPGFRAHPWDDAWHAFSYGNYARLFTALTTLDRTAA
ncbi:ABC transporter substrate-binding protein [Actinoplanes flavus]|uniref:ABC transporter substrate-binding protein n=1 Tax=Actinoplanes flavus TaxID=2820290 RepID=A0ABS3UN67_9ACTN|nr:ABC transporter substrate-binding protein [Actinoplanes flavus]MBO3740218.1 ABC transporter substrate-binding protein [Actinoplanes flavus]